MKGAAGLLAALLVAPALWTWGCEGTSSGVDNPGVSELTVEFRDAQGAAVPVSGDLDIFAEDQNPALHPEPLATIKVLNSPRTNLSSGDFDRIRDAIRGTPRAKRAAADAQSPPPADSLPAFNVVFRGQARVGSLAFGLDYDPVRRTFRLSGAEIARLELRPKPMVRFAARMRREAVHAGLGRVYIPGSPYLATLADSEFVLEEIPEGVFGLRLLAGDGSIFAVEESLDTRASRTFTAALEPLGRIDSSDTAARPLFTVEAVGPAEAFANTPAWFDVKIIGYEHAEGRASYLWRQIDANAPGPVRFQSPAIKSPEVQFLAAGVYTLEVTVTIGVATARDTLIQKVRDPPLPAEPRIVFPRPKDSLIAGGSYKLAWEMPAAGSATVELSRSSGAWETLARDVPSISGLSYLAWMPPDSLAPSPNCYLRVRLMIGGTPDSLIAQSEYPFSLFARAPALPPPAGSPTDTLREP